MPVPSAPIINETTAVRALMRPLQGYIEAPGVIEVCVNKPGEVWVETYNGWQRFENQALSAEALKSLARAIATVTSQRTGENAPLLSASLPTGERIQIAQPPATKHGIVGIALRKPNDGVKRLSDLEGSGLFMHTGSLQQHAIEVERQLLELNGAKQYGEFLRQAVLERKTIVLAGATGSGKTTFMKALAEEIPHDQRLITIEDAEEVKLPNHGNKLHLCYSKGGQGVAPITANSLLESCMRFRPDRILLAEVRGEEAFSFLDSAASGHPGSMTTIHAGSCDEAMERMALLVRKSGAGSGMTMPEIKQLAASVIDIVVHFARINGKFAVTGLLYRPRLLGGAHGSN
ncbi:MAG: P-type DNA transfer ATPase VirB11 [Rhodocyclales bacterium]|nr:P-type DNA transfer ATPase VirB11 [Rhodocyclales bacterium]